MGQALRTLLRPIRGNSDLNAALGPSLRALLESASFDLVDIGARGKSVPQLRLLAPYSRYFAVEPDASEAQRLRASLQAERPWREVIVVSDAIASTEGEATLRITKQPGLSSLLKPDAAEAALLGQADQFAVDREVQVATLPLAAAAAKHGFEDAAFIKVDTQGTELDILNSGDALVRGPVAGIGIEVEFQPMYKGQPLFAEVDTYLRERGFRLFDMDRSLVRHAPAERSIYSRRQVAWAHTLYLKEPALLTGSPAGSARLVGLAMAFEHFDYAIWLVSEGPGADEMRERFGSALADEIRAVARAFKREADRRFRSIQRSTRLRSATAKDRLGG